MIVAEMNGVVWGLTMALLILTIVLNLMEILRLTRRRMRRERR